MNGGLPPPRRSTANSPPPALEPTDASSQQPANAAESPKSPNADKEAKRQRNRLRCVKELIETEQTYVDQLQLLLDLYVVPLQNGKIIKAKRHAVLFPDIATILGLNTNLLMTLKTKFASWDNAVSCIGDEFIKFGPYFKMYQNYVSNHEAATKMMDELKNNQSFQEFCIKQQMDPRAKALTLPSFLILPVQRIPRYELCFRELIKLTPPIHPDYDNLLKAMDLIGSVNASVNDRIRDHETRDKVRHLERRFINPMELVDPARRFIREGRLFKVCRKKDIKYTFILLSDQLIYSTEKGDGRLKLHHVLPLDRYFKVVNVENNRKYGDSCWEIHSTVKSFLVHCDSTCDASKEEWLKDLTAAIDHRRAYRAKVSISETDVKRLAPVWFPDDFSDNCMNATCLKKFTFTRRRHHCRYCGFIVCGDCSSNKLPNPNREEELVRVCQKCFNNNKMDYPDLEKRMKTRKKSGGWLGGRKNTRKMSEEDDDWDDSSDEKSLMTTPTARSNTMGRTTPVFHQSGSNRAFPETASPTGQSARPRRGNNTPEGSPKPPRPSAVRSSGSSSRNLSLQPLSSGLSSASLHSQHSRSFGSVSEFGQSRDNSHKNDQLLQVMQKKLADERAKNAELQRQLTDLRQENARLRKSKVDLVTWANTEINSLKKQLNQKRNTVSHAPSASSLEGSAFTG